MSDRDKAFWLGCVGALCLFGGILTGWTSIRVLGGATLCFALIWQYRINTRRFR